MSDEKATSLFWDVFTIGGSTQADCACGRRHFTRKEDDYEDKKILIQLMNEECGGLDLVVGTDDDSVGYMTINGVVLCYGCPCGSTAKYENLLINEQERILSYYRKRAEKKRAELEELDGGLAALPVPDKEKR